VISIFVPFRNAPDLARECLGSLLNSVRNLRAERDVEFVFVDDASSPEYGIAGLLVDFRKSVKSTVHVLQLKTHQHYTGAVSYGLSKARGAQVILISHDMLATSDYLRTLLAVAATDPTLGIIRGTSASMHGSIHEIAPPAPPQSYPEIQAFSAFIANTYGLSFASEPSLIGDSMLIQRSVIKKIGVMDRLFLGFMGDVDYGIRAVRAGFKMVTAKGAWLHHIGGGAIKSDVAAGRHLPTADESGRNLVESGYHLLREKWVAGLPPTIAELKGEHFEALRKAPAPGGGEYVAPVTIDPDHCVLL
jgi:GT2 family glycosyltransferase